VEIEYLCRREEQAVDLLLGTEGGDPDPAWLRHRCLSEPFPAPSDLYNSAKDPGEQHNLADREPDYLHRMMHELENWFESVEKDRLENRAFQV
jgi:hypothetical protein